MRTHFNVGKISKTLLIAIFIFLAVSIFLVLVAMTVAYVNFDFWLFVVFICILIAGILADRFCSEALKWQRARKIIIAQRDVINVLELLKKDIAGALSGYYKDKELNKTETSDIEFLLKRANERIEKMKEYLVENIREINPNGLSSKRYIDELLYKIFKK